MRQPDALRRLVRAAQAEHRLPSVSAAVRVRGETVYEEALGVADADADLPATPDTQYRVGSITKTFTAAAVLALRDEGRLDLDDRLGEHLPEAGARPLTLRRLLAHASGLQREPPGGVWETFAFPSASELLARLDETEQVLEPGSHWHYSNLAFALLGLVVARVAGTPFEEFVAERFLVPLGLRRTSWRRTEPAARGYLVDPFADRLLPEGELEASGALAAAGDLWSTPDDLCRWGAWLGGREEVHAVQVMADSDAWRLGWGLGVMLHRRGDRILFGHDGAMPGFLASLVCSRTEDVAAAVACNASTPAAAVLELATALAEEAIASHPREPEPWRPGQPPPAELETALGTWWSEGEQFVFRWRGGRLEAAAAGARPWVRPAAFEREADDRYRAVEGRERGERLELVRDAAGTVVRLVWATYAFTRELQVLGPDASPPGQRSPENP